MEEPKESEGEADGAKTATVVLEVTTVGPLGKKHSFCETVGYDGVCLLVFVLINAGLHLYVAYLYTIRFSNWKRPWVWLFALFAGFFIFLFAFCVVRWRHMATDFTKQLEKSIRVTEKGRLSRLDLMQIAYAHWKMDGKYFLLKLYTLEIIESIVQSNNFISFFVCSLPVEITIPMAVVLSIDSFHTSWIMSHKNRPKSRNRQVTIDTLMDFVFTTIPLPIIFFQYDVPISIYEMVNVVALPSICILAKIDDMFEEIVRYRSEEVYVIKTADPRRRTKARKHSLMRMHRRAKQQDNEVPKTFRAVLFTLKTLFGVLFLVLGIVQLAMHNTVVCDNSTWDRCLVKVPFCSSPFRATCNCAVLYVENHNWTKVPSSIKEMVSLRKMTIKDGPLDQLFDTFSETYESLSYLDLNHNNLSELPSTLPSLNYLARLDATNNRLTDLPKNIWSAPSLFSLDVSNNDIRIIPEGSKKATSLRTLLISNNSVALVPSELGSLGLYQIALDGNTIRSVPASFGNLNTLQYLFLHNNRYISKIPAQMGQLGQLKVFDLRNNSLTSLPSELGGLKSLKYLYLEGNPLCNISNWISMVPPNIRASVSGESGAGCKRQCSPYCQDPWLKDKECYSECNSEACKFHDGVCSA